MGVGHAAPAKRPTWARTLFFAALLLLALGTCGLSFTFLPRILEEPHLFALVFSLGSVAAVSAFAFSSADPSFRAAASPCSRPGPGSAGFRHRRQFAQVRPRPEGALAALFIQ